MKTRPLIMFTIVIIAMLLLAACTTPPIKTLPATNAPGAQGGDGPAIQIEPVNNGSQPVILPPPPDAGTTGLNTGVVSTGVDTPVSSASMDPSTNLQEVTGVVKDLKSGLILIALTNNGGDFMLRISDNTKWAEGVDKTVKLGNYMTCRVKPEPTFAPPSQGEVYLVMKNG